MAQTSKRRNNRYIFPVAALGIAAQVAQIVFLRELLMVFQGNELSLGVILAAWMLWAGFGSRVGGRLAARLGREADAVVLIAASTVFLPVVTIAVIRVLRGFFTIDPGALFSVFDMAVSCVVVMAPTAFLFGMQFVMLSALWRKHDREHDTSGAEKTYIGEAIGNILGGLLFSFVLVHFFNSFQVLAIVGGVMVLAAAPLVLRPVQGEVHGGVQGGVRGGNDSEIGGPGWRAGSRWLVFSALGGVAVLLVAAERLDQWGDAMQWRFFAPQFELVETRQSRYGNIQAALRGDQYSFFQSGNRVFSAAAAGSPRPGMEEQEGVVFAHFAMTQHPAPERVLLVGGGLRGTVREMARHPVSRIDYIELDPVLTGIARPLVHESTIQILDSPLVNLIHADGRFFLKQTDNTYDMIIADVPDPATAVLNRYYTEAFFREVERRLEPGGVFVIGAVSTPDLRGEAVANRNATIYHTLRRVFPDVLPVGQRFCFFLASNETGRLSADIQTLRERWSMRGIEADGFSPAQFDLLLEEMPLRRMNWVIRNHGRTETAHLGPPAAGPIFPGAIAEQNAREADLPPVNERFFINSDFKPIGYYHTLRLWDAFARGGGGERDRFRWIMQVRPWWLAPAVAGVLALQLLLSGAPVFRQRRFDRRFAVFLAVFTTGFSTMALQVALIFSFQGLYGFVYEMIGLITALFMAGLAVGTIAGRRLVRNKADMGILAYIQLFIALFAMVIAVLLPQAGAFATPAIAAVFIACLTFISGALNGVDFPIAAACCQLLEPHPEKAAGRVYGAELFGACAGALFTSVVVAPVLGLAAVCVLAAAGNFTAFLALAVVSGVRFLQRQSG